MSSPSKAAEQPPGQRQPGSDGLALFEKKIRPVLEQHCYECHSAGAKKIKGGLRVDTPEALMHGGDGGPVIVPGNPDKSRLIQAIRYLDEDLQMPPKGKLSAEQRADFEEWVRLGAPAPRPPEISNPKSQISNPPPAASHWAFRPIASHTVPKVKDHKWPKSQIDHFILADLEEKKLRPTPASDRRTLIRRATFDLIGLPPALEEIEAFLADRSSDAFARVVDRLLDSPHFGERWGRHWLDVVRYADSNGLEANVPYPNAWKYRDYVIASFNQDKPFDQFIREQLAGDLLPSQSDEERFEHLIATGFLVLGPKALGEPNRDKLVMDVADEQIDASTKAFLGLTVSCARCHDHKFDPIPTRDYYALAGIFKSTATLSGAGDQRLGRDRPRWMERPLASEQMAKQIEERDKTLAKLAEELRLLGEFLNQHPGGIQSSKLPGILVDNTAAQLSGRWKESQGLTNFVDRNYLHDANSDKGRMTARFVPDLPHTGLYEVLVAYTPRYDRATNVPVTIHGASATRTVHLNQQLAPPYWKAFASAGTFQLQAGTNDSVAISNEGTKGFVVIDAVAFVPIDEWKLELARLAEAAMKEPAPRMSGESPEPASQILQMAMVDPARTGRPAYQKLADTIKDLQANPPPVMPVAMAVQEGTAQNSRIHLRGDYERLGDEVPRGFLQVLTGKNPSPVRIDPGHSGRLELARWIASSENPLTARVAVNRVWLHLFGQSLVQTPDNFGVMGEKPTHPELLDFLAGRFVAEGWSMKKLIRALMLSSAYQMSCDHNPKAYAKDPDNRYWWRMNRRRLEAEAIRDAILAITGQLDRTRGGSLMPTNTAPMNGPMASDPPLASNRRSVYLPVIRNNVNGLFQVFDFVDPHAVTGKRHITTAAPQALFMMNSEFVIESARRWAESLLGRSGMPDDRQRISLAYVAAIGRPPKRDEIERALRFLQSFQAALPPTEANAETRRRHAWQGFCQALLASTEFRFLD